MTHDRSHLLKIATIGSIVMAAAVMEFVFPVEALAAGDGSDWRPIFDLVMRWVNFLILVFIIVKFSRTPIKNFLAGRKQAITDKIEELESEKKKIVTEIDKNQELLENSLERLSQLKKRIIAEGEKNRLKIIKDAETESKLMLEGAGQKMNSRIQEAHHTLRAEIVDLAVTIAMQKLPGEVTEQDNQKFINAFLTETIE